MAAAQGASIDLFDPQPFGTDPKGNWVAFTLMFVSGVIGAVPRMGKTFALRLLLLIAALDPRAEIHAYDLKEPATSRRWSRWRTATAPVTRTTTSSTRWVRCGAARGDAPPYQGDPRTAARHLPGQPAHHRACVKKSLGLHPIVVGSDEVQKWFEHKDHGKDIEEIVTDLVKRGPATGIVVLLATQRPDAKSIPAQISDNAILRFCLMVSGQVPNDMVLGTSSYQNGERATEFNFKRDKGVGLLKGVVDETTTVKTVKFNGPDSVALIERARAHRQAEGRITGYAAGLDATVDESKSAPTRCCKT